MKTFEEIARKYAEDKQAEEQATRDKKQRRNALFVSLSSDFNKYATKFRRNMRSDIHNDGIKIETYNNNTMILTLDDNDRFNTEVRGTSYRTTANQAPWSLKDLTVEDAQYLIIKWLDAMN